MSFVLNPLLPPKILIAPHSLFIILDYKPFNSPRLILAPVPPIPTSRKHSQIRLFLYTTYRHQIFQICLCLNIQNVLVSEVSTLISFIPLIFTFRALPTRCETTQDTLALAFR